MIKINLLGVAPPRTTKIMSGVGAPPAPLATLVIVFVGAVIICFGIVGVIYKIWSNQIADLEKARDHEKLRAAELASVKAQNARYQQRLKDLETRINTIQALQNGRVGPVELMSSLANVISKTNDVYLYTLSPVAGKVQLKGESGTVDSMANFIGYLKSSGYYDDVQLDQFYQDDQHDRLAYKFQLTCDFRSSTGGASPTAGAAPTLPPGVGAGPPGAGAVPSGPRVPPGPNQPYPTRLMR
jgi:Tfp pilus assembly protein PilN